MKKLVFAFVVILALDSSVFAAEKIFSFTTNELSLIAQSTEQEYTVTVRIRKPDGSNGGTKSYKVTATSSYEAEEKAKRLAAADCPWGTEFTAISCSPERSNCYSR